MDERERRKLRREALENAKKDGHPTKDDLRSYREDYDAHFVKLVDFVVSTFRISPVGYFNSNGNLVAARLVREVTRILDTSPTEKAKYKYSGDKNIKRAVAFANKSDKLNPFVK